MKLLPALPVVSQHYAETSQPDQELVQRAMRVPSANAASGHIVHHVEPLYRERQAPVQFSDSQPAAGIFKMRQILEDNPANASRADPRLSGWYVNHPRGCRSGYAIFVEVGLS